jgi:hypothetical protein
MAARRRAEERWSRKNILARFERDLVSCVHYNPVKHSAM